MDCRRTWDNRDGYMLPYDDHSAGVRDVLVASGCDDPHFIREEKHGPRSCDWVAEDPARCALTGASGNRTVAAADACREACGTCAAASR